MSVSSQITRIKDAKAAIKTAIAAKGVTVPEGALIDDYAALIGNISGGGDTSVVASGKCGEHVTWELYNTGELIISGAGAMYELSNSSDYQFYDYRDSIKNIVVEYGVATIGFHTFFNYKQLESVTISDSVTKIGNQVFANCDSLKNVTIGDGVTTIDFGAFIRCKSLVSITIGKGVTTIANQAFSECTNLLDVYYEGTKAEWDSVSIGYDNDNLKNATLHCEYTGSTGGEEDYNEGYEAGKLDGYSEGYTASQNARQEKTFVENGEYTPDEGYSGFSKVTVNVTDVDTVDGWHVAVRNDGSAPPSGTINTITFVYGAGE